MRRDDINFAKSKEANIFVFVVIWQANYRKPLL